MPGVPLANVSYLVGVDGGVALLAICKVNSRWRVENKAINYACPPCLLEPLRCPNGLRAHKYTYDQSASLEWCAIVCFPLFVVVGVGGDV